MPSAYAEIAAAFPWFFPAVVGVFGACIGSFLNVVIYRLPKNESIVSPGSHCACGQPIKWYDNIPVFSWFILRGKARCCGRPYSFRYAFVELLTAGLFVACWLLFPPAKAACGILLVSAFVCATFIDLDHLIIPDVFTVGLGVAGVVLSFAVPALHDQHGGIFIVDSLRSGVISLQGLFVGSGLVLWILLLAEAVLKKEAMGFGDVKLAGAVGAFCGWQGAVFAMFGGAMIGTAWFALAYGWQKLTGKASALAPKAETPGGEATELGFGAHIPFGPAIALAGLLHFLYFHQWVAAYFAQIGALL